jgi:hypothetical protein
MNQTNQSSVRDIALPNFYSRDSTIAQIESSKCCNQNKTQWKYWAQWTSRPLKNAKIQTKTHEMDVLEAVENETLESHIVDILDTMDR